MGGVEGRECEMNERGRVVGRREGGGRERERWGWAGGREGGEGVGSE